MRRPAILAGAAERDIDEAARWYRSRGGPHLADAFVDAVEATLVGIERFPEAYPVVHDRGTRRALVVRFPYLLLFVPRAERIDVLRCFHASRDMRRWRPGAR